jgi:D-3-phosphoglycerate dehydrogenase
MDHPYFQSLKMTAPLAIPSTSPRAVAASISPSQTSTLHDRLRKRDSFSIIRQPKVLHPVDNEDLRLLLVENISQDAVRAFQAQGFHVDHYAKALSEDELIKKIPQYHAIGIRSKTKITERVIKAASKVRPSDSQRITTF